MSEPTLKETAKEEEGLANEWVTIEALRTITALMWYEFNVHKDTIIKEIYGMDHNEGYIDEKVKLLNRRGILWVFAQLDGSHRKRMVKAIIERYRADSIRAVRDPGKE